MNDQKIPNRKNCLKTNGQTAKEMDVLWLQKKLTEFNTTKDIP